MSISISLISTLLHHSPMIIRLQWCSHVALVHWTALDVSDMVMDSPEHSINRKTLIQLPRQWYNAENHTFVYSFFTSEHVGMICPTERCDCGCGIQQWEERCADHWLCSRRECWPICSQLPSSLHCLGWGRWQRTWRVAATSETYELTDMTVC